LLDHLDDLLSGGPSDEVLMGPEDEDRMRRVMDRLRDLLEAEAPPPNLSKAAPNSRAVRRCAAVSGEIIIP
jgi:hypothetical protein